VVSLVNRDQVLRIMNNVYIAVILLSCLTTCIGVYAALLVRENAKAISCGIGFSVGIMVLISVLELLPESVAEIEFTAAILTASAGAALVWLAHFIIPHIPGVARDTMGIELRRRIEKGEIAGPRIFTGASIIEGPRTTFPGDVEVHSEAEMRAEVKRQAALGVDLVKLYWNTPIEFIRAAVDEAHSLGLQVVGHLRQTSWTAAAQAGIDGLVHSAGDGPTWELVAADERDGLRSLPYRDYYARFEVLIDFDAPQFDDLVSALVENNVTVDPTLVTMQSLYFGDDLTILDRLEPGVASPAIHETWGDGWETGNPFVLGNVGGQDLTYGKGMFTIALEMVRRFHERGVHLAVGTDVGMPWITPGVSFHRELELLTDAGIPTLDVLSLATMNGAETVRREGILGTIEPGKLADFVILRDSPTDDIANTRSIEAVYKGGQRFEPQTLLFDVP
jgi:hypothetical protein